MVGANKNKAKYWFGIGASAGGLEALRGLVRNLPIGLDATYIVAQHMAPDFKSMLTEIIGRETEMSVVDVTDGITPKRDTIYIAPPNYNLVIDGDKILLKEPGNKPGSPKPSVNLFLQTLAKSKGKFAVAAILSGTGSDGAEGIVAIRATGGVTIAQDEHTAKYSSMPMAAMQTGCVDLVMSPEELGAQFSKIILSPRNLDSLKASPLDLDGVAELIRLLLEQTRVNFRFYKIATLQRRIERRMAAQRVTSLDDYVTIAKGSREEVQALFKDLLISVTSFFRDPDEFLAVQTHIKAIVDGKNNDSIRAWIAGTATGEETYSLAILFAEALGGPENFERYQIQFFATDIDSDALEVARRGFYSESAVNGLVPEDYVHKYFDKVPSGYSVKKFIREKIVFSNHNTVNDPPFLNMDFISCRNLLIYFQAPLQAEAFSRFHYSLVPNGVLFLGKSEAITASETLFRAADGDKHVFFQRPSEKRRLLRAHLYELGNVGATARTVKKPPPERRDLEVSNARFESLVQALGPNAILVNSELKMLTAYGDIDRYIGVKAGAIDASATTMLKEPYRHDVRTTAPMVLRSKRPVIGVARTSSDQPNMKENTSIYPILGGPNEEPMALVVFSEWEVLGDSLAPVETMGEVSSQRMTELENELQVTKSTLQQVSEELETSNEELQSSNEELQSSNEELQSTNEELETSNEELQSTNEELSTVNEELQVNSQQLNTINQSLQNILENVTIPMLVVDRNLNITNASSASADVFGDLADISLPHLSRCELQDGYPNLVKLAGEAIKTGQRVDVPIISGEHSSTLMIVPHISHIGSIVGAIILVTNDTVQLKLARNQLELIFNYVPNAIIVRDKNGEILRSNAAAQKMAGLSGKGLRGKNYYEIIARPFSENYTVLDKEILETGISESNVLRQIAFTKKKPIWVRESLIVGDHPAKDEKVIYAILKDVTESHQTNEALLLSEQRLEQAIKVSSIGFWDWNLSADEVYYSDKYLEIVGLKRQNPQLKKARSDFEMRIHPDDRVRVMEALDSHLNKRTNFFETYRIVIGKNGRKAKWVDAHGQASWDSNGVAFRFLGALQDTTQQHTAIAEQKEREQHLTLAARLSGLGYWKIDLESEKILWSDQVYSIHGVLPEDYKPTLESALGFYHEKDKERVRKVIESSVDKGQPFEFEAQILRSDGALRTVRSVCSPNTGSKDGVNEVFGVFQDITTDKMRQSKLETTLEELSRSNEELNRFSYVCSHDMKEPVRMIEAMAGLLIEPELKLTEEKQSELLFRISNNTKRLRGIIDSLLAYSRIDASVETGEIDLSVVLHDIIEGLAMVIEESNAQIKIGKMPILFGSKVHFLQLFQNLIGNALKFNDMPNPKISISSRQRKNDVVLLVEDNGPGIPEASRADVFTLFRRLKRRDEVEGTGLGLSIAQKIVAQYGGEISCIDTKLGGIGFQIILPCKRHPNEL